MTSFVRLKILVLLLFLPRLAKTYELFSIDDEYVSFIIDICKLYRTKSIIFLYSESIKEIEMTTTTFKWTRALSREGFTTTNIYFSELKESSYYVNRIVRPYYIAFISNYNAVNEFSLVTSNFNMSFATWLVLFISKANDHDYCHSPPGNIFHLKFNTEMLVRCGTENILREWYSIDSNRTEIDDLATWSLKKGITKMVPDFLYKRRYNLKGYTMRAILVKSSSLLSLKKNGELDGQLGRLLTELRLTLNFNFKIVSEVETFGRWNPEEKTWSGAIGELYSGHADICFSGFSMTNARLNAVDFTFPLLSTRNYLYIQEPHIFSIKWSSYFLTFASSVWVATFGILVLATILLILFKIKIGTDHDLGNLLYENFLDIWGIFCQQGLADFPHRSSLRIAYFSIFILAVVLSAAYSAALISYLTSGIRKLPFQSLESFVEDGTYQFSVAHDTAEYDLFANSGDPLAKKLMKLMLDEKKLPVDILEGFLKICKNRKLAFYTSRFLKDSINHKIPCNIVSIKTGHVDTFSLILSKHNQFTDVINFHDIKEFSLATNTFEMSFAGWLVLFVYNGHDPDYCHNPPDNIFHLRFDSHFFVRCATETILREWYSIKTNRTEIRDVAVWSLEKAFTKTVPGSLYERRYNLQGLTIRSVLVKASPFVYINEAGQLDGLLGRMLDEFSVTLNFTFDIVSEVETYGIWNSVDNTWSGAIGELYSGRADISLSGFSMTNARLNAVDFTFPLVSSKIYLYMQEPDIFAIKWTSYFTFSRSLWIAIFGVLIVTLILLIFLKMKDKNDGSIGQLLSDNFLEIWGIFCQQGLEDFPDRSSLRIVYFSVILLATVLSAAYSASLISYLTAGIHILPFSSLESFVQDGTYQLSVLRGTAEYDMFANSDDPLEKKLMKLMLDEEKLPLTVPEGFMKICYNHKLAIYTSKLVKDILIHNLPCDIVSIDTGRLNAIGIVLSKHNPFTKFINFHDIKEFSLVTNTFDISIAVWLVLFVYNGHDPDYCHNPPDNIFHLRFDSHFFVRCGTETILREWYSIRTNRTEIRDVAVWSLEKAFTKTVPGSLYERRYNLQGLTIRAILIKASPFVYINEAGQLDGLLGRMLDEFSVTLNFTFDIVSEVETYGIWNSVDNTWSGAIGELYSGRADICLSAFTMTNARLNAVDFTFPFANKNDRSIGQLLSDNFLEVWGIFCQQGLADIPDRFSLRIAYFSIFLLAVIISAAYSASMTSILTAGIQKLPFQSLEDFVEDGSYRLIVVHDTAEYDIFANSDEPLEKKLMKLMLDKQKLPLTLHEGFMNICNNHKLAIFTLKLEKDITIRNLPCNIVSVDTGRLSALGLILSKHNPFTNIINIHLKKFINNGMNNRIRDILSEKESNDIKHQPVYITSVISLFLFVLIEMEMKTTMFKLTRALSREGFSTTSFYFSELHKSSYHVNRIMRPHYIVIISNDNDVNEFSLATSNFDMSFPVWLVLFIYNGHDPDYCHDPPGNVFHLRFDSEMLVRCDTENILREWYSIDIGLNRTVIDDLATWSTEKGISKIAPDFLYERRYNLQGLTMRAVLVKSSPTIYMNEVGELDGMFGTMLQELCVTLNFSFKIISEIETYGKWDPKKNTWTGAIGEIYSGRADISFSAFTMTKARSNAIDFTFPLIKSKIFLYVREPEMFEIRWSSYFISFSRSIWIAMFAALIVVSILLIFFKIKDKNDRSIGLLLSDNFLDIWGIFCQQGLADIPDRFSLRIAYFSIFLLTVITSAAYSASMMSYLTAGIHALPFRSLEGFVEDGTYRFSVYRGSADYDFFANSDEPLAKKLMKLMLNEEKLPVTVPEGFTNICENHKLAIYSSSLEKQSGILKMPCNIVQIDTGRTKVFAMILSKNNPFTRVINFYLKKFMNNGMNNRNKDIVSEKESNEMEMTRTMFKWTRALSREGFATTKFYFSDIQKSSYYIHRIVRPQYIVIISNDNDVNEFSLASSTFDMSFAVWLILFVYDGHDPDYCHNPPGNVFHLRYDSEVLVLCGTENFLREWYSINTNRTEVDNFATWSLERGIAKVVSGSLYERRHDLQGLTMRAVLVKASQFVYTDKSGEFHGLLSKMIRTLCTNLNFNIKIVSEVVSYGRWNPKRKIWTGAIGELFAGRADIALPVFALTKTRLSAVDFSFPLLTTKTYLYIQEPGIFEIEWSCYFLTFSRSIWFGILGVLLVTSILLIFLKMKDKKDRSVGQLLIDNLLEVWNIFCQRGVEDIPDRFSLRIAYFSVFFFAVIISAAYSASMTSFLTAGIRKLPFQSLESFVEDGSYRLIIVRDTAEYDIFANSDDPLEKELMKLMLDEEKLPMTIHEGFMDICKNHKLAIYTSSEIHEDTISNMPCDIVPIDTGRVEALGMILSKGNPFTSIINTHIKDYINKGMNNHIRDTISRKESNDIQQHQPVHFINVISLFLFILVEMEMKTTMFKLTRALSREGFSTTSFYFWELHKSSYHVTRFVRPHYIAIISNDNDVNEFSLVTSNFDMSFPVWLVLFIYNGHDPDYCHDPPGNVFHLRFDSEMLVRCDTENILREWYSIDIGLNRTVIDDLATWSTEKGISKIAPDYLYERRYNLQGLTMKAVLVKSSLTIYINEVGELDGLLGRMLRELCVSLNFNFKIISEVETYGKWDPKENTWTGAIGEIYFRRADISFSAFTMTKARLNVVDFTIPLTFSRSIWIAIFTVLFFVPILLIFLKMKGKDDRSIGQLLSDNFLDIWGIFCQQGLADFPNRSSLRIAYFSIIVLATILSAAYSASFISFLTAGIRILPFHSLESFVEDGTYKLSVFRDTAEYEMFANSNDLLEKKMMKLMLDEEKLTSNVLEGFIKICDDPKLALYSSDILKDSVFLQIPCKIVGVETGHIGKSSMILSKGNPFTDVINFHLLKFINSGMNNRMKDLSSGKKSNDMIQHQPIDINSSRNLFNVRFNTEMLVTCPHDNIIREWYSLRDNQTEMLDLAILKPDGAFSFLTNLSLNYRRNNMNGLALKTVVVENSPYIKVDKNGTMSGLFGDVLTELIKAANFTLNIVKFTKEYGRWDEEKNIWTGTVGEIAAGHADISISEFSLTNSRLDVIDYIVPIIVNPMHFYIKDPLLYRNKWTGYFKVFDSKIWIFIIVIILTAPSLVAILKMNDNPERGIHRIVSMILENYLQFWGIFCQQGLAEFPYRLSLRLAYFSTFLSAFVVFTAYSGTLVSFLTNNFRILPFHSFEELVNDGTYQVIVYKGGSDYDMFAYGNDQLSKRMMKIMKKKEKLPSSFLEGIFQVCNEQRVTFLTSVEIELSLQINNNNSLCKMDRINSGQIITLAMILTKNSPFMNLINHHMNQLLYNGVINRLKTKNMKMMEYEGSKYKSVSFQSVYPVFDLLKIGLAINMGFSHVIHRWICELSRNGFMSVGIEISNIRDTSYYENRIIRPLFVVFLTDEKSIKTFSNNTRNFNMAFAYWYVIFLPGYNQNDYCPIPKGNPFNLLFNTEMLVSCPKDRIMREWYSLRANQTKVFELAKWEPNKKLTFLTELTLYERRNSLDGLVLPAVFVMNNPFIDIDSDGNLSGSCGKILIELSRLVNFSFAIVNNTVSNGRWNAKYNKWNGAVGELIENRAQISMSYVSMSSPRLDVVDFTIPFILSSFSLYIKEPDVLDIEWSNYFRAFSFKLWIVLIVLLLTTPILLVWMKITLNQDNYASLISDSYLEIWGIFCQQGLVEFPQRSSLRLAYISLFLLALIVSSAYSASLISFLTNVVHRLPFVSLEEFVQDGTYKLITAKDSLEYDVFANSKQPLAKKVMSFMIAEERLPPTPLDGFFQLCNEHNIAMYVSTEVRNVLDPEIPCNIVHINLGHIDSVSLMWSKKNQFLSLINHHLFKFMRNGMIKQLNSQSNSNNKKCKKKIGLNAVQVWSIIPILSFLEIGVFLSLCMFIVEKLYFARVVFIILFDKRVVIKGLNATSQDYLFLITKVYASYGSSSVFFVDSGHSDNLQMSTMLHSWSREISRQGILSMSISFAEFEKMSYYQISRPLFVIIISTWKNLEEFSKVTKEINVSLYIWFVLFVETPDNPLETFCKNPIGNIFNLSFDTEMLILCYDEMILKEWYSIQGNDTIISNYAIWEPGKDFSLTTNMSLYTRRSDLFGKVLRVGWVKDSPFIGMKNNKLNMLLGEIVTELTKMINFTLEILEPVDAYGSWNKDNETWSGVIGQLISGEADIGVAEFTVTTGRLQAVDFTLPFILSRNRLYMKEPSGASIQWSAYFKTFSFGIWTMLILVITTTPILLTVIKTKGSFSGSLLSENYIHVWGIYCQQGLAEFPTEPSLRLAFISIFVSAIIVSAAYSASLISFLTVTTGSLPFSSLDDFANARSYHLIVFGNSADYDMFVNAKDEVIVKMMTLMKPKRQLPTSLHDGFDQVCQEKVAFYTTEEMKKTLNLYLPCKVNYIETGRSDSLAMTLPKGSPFKGVINYHLQKFIDNGIMNRLRGLFVIQTNLSKTSHSAVSLWGIAPILAVLSGGTMLCIIILIMERIYYHFKIKKEFSKSDFKRLYNGLNVLNSPNIKRIDKNYILDKLNRAQKINEFKPSINYFP
ncbi:hypothetical protein V1478_018007 [Vespula squamosa]|uniref:Uncharacterized protein n=1 Tax=Vespula squamosa TaxID=30214 RepID=A0ABD1ZVT5_VESSQ